MNFFTKEHRLNILTEDELELLSDVLILARENGYAAMKMVGAAEVTEAIRAHNEKLTALNSKICRALEQYKRPDSDPDILVEVCGGIAHNVYSVFPDLTVEVYDDDEMSEEEEREWNRLHETGKYHQIY